jgi:hypothetical protein
MEYRQARYLRLPAPLMRFRGSSSSHGHEPPGGDQNKWGPPAGLQRHVINEEKDGSFTDVQRASCCFRGLLKLTLKEAGMALPANMTKIVRLRNAIMHRGFLRGTDNDVAPNFYPAAIGVWSSVMPCWAVVAAIRGAEPSVERSAADRRAAA